MAQKRALCLLFLFAFFACARTRISRSEWSRMNASEKTLYVRTLLGHETVKARKGGNDRAYTLPPEEYVAQIDQAYARGDQRPVDAIFEEMGSKR
jgi:predicted Fe-S protein YdhL (DUF1289 family)